MGSNIPFLRNTTTIALNILLVHVVVCVVYFISFSSDVSLSAAPVFGWLIQNILGFPLAVFNSNLHFSLDSRGLNLPLVFVIAILNAAIQSVIVVGVFSGSRKVAKKSS